jgi:predicted enzyme related to lactoylglutathione lyase
MIRGIKFASVPVRDQDRALRFYTDNLGFKVVTDQPFDKGGRWIELGISGRETRLVLFTPDGQEDRIGTMSNVTFMSDNVAKSHEELTARGVTFTTPPQVMPWGTYAIFEDSDGNTFVLSSR